MKKERGDGEVKGEGEGEGEVEWRWGWGGEKVGRVMGDGGK